MQKNTNTMTFNSMSKWGALLTLMLLPAGAVPAEQNGPLRMEVFVSVPPQAYLIERIGGEHVNIHVLVQPGQNPHTLEVTPKQMMQLSAARLYFKGGMPFETQLVKKLSASHKQLVMVDTNRRMDQQLTPRRDHHQHDDPNHEHHRGEVDPHTWLSPPLIRIQAINIAAALIDADPQRTNYYMKNLAKLLTDIGETHAMILKSMAPYKGRSFYVFHPAFGHFAQAYGLKQVSVEVEGKAPTPKTLAALIKRARAEEIRVIFVQPQFDKKNAQAIASAIDGVVVTMDPLAKDVLANLRGMARRVQEALAKKGTSQP